MSEPPIAVTLKLDERALPAEEFEHVSARAGLIAERRVKREEALENFGKPGRDEVAFGSLFAGIAKRAGWVPHMKLAQLRHDWASIVGDVIARNTWVGAIDNGVLTIHAKSPSHHAAHVHAARAAREGARAPQWPRHPRHSRHRPAGAWARHASQAICAAEHALPSTVIQLTACAAKNQKSATSAKNTSPPMRVESLVV